MKLVYLILLCAILTSCAPSSTQQTTTAVLAKKQPQAASPTKVLTTTTTATASSIPTVTKTSTSKPTASPIATSTSIATVPPGWISFQGEGMRLIFPETWTQQSPPPNPLGNVTFLFLVREADGTNISFSYGSGNFAGAETAEEIEQVIWDVLMAVYDGLDLKDQVVVESVSVFNVGGQTGIKRVFHAPGLLDPTTIYSKIFVVVVHGDAFYQIVVTATNPNALGNPEIPEILTSIQLEP